MTEFVDGWFLGHTLGEGAYGEYVFLLRPLLTPSDRPHAACIPSRDRYSAAISRGPLFPLFGTHVKTFVSSLRSPD
ncbi:hypothetical protein P5V15_003905 [Pogonomyrmex californicus]